MTAVPNTVINIVCPVKKEDCKGTVIRNFGLQVFHESIWGGGGSINSPILMGQFFIYLIFAKIFAIEG
jgi:hypothetical protein